MLILLDINFFLIGRLTVVNLILDWPVQPANKSHGSVQATDYTRNGEQNETGTLVEIKDDAIKSKMATKRNQFLLTTRFVLSRENCV